MRARIRCSACEFGRDDITVERASDELDPHIILLNLVCNPQGFLWHHWKHLFTSRFSFISLVVIQWAMWSFKLKWQIDKVNVNEWCTSLQFTRDSKSNVTGISANVFSPAEDSSVCDGIKMNEYIILIIHVTKSNRERWVTFSKGFTKLSNVFSLVYLFL